MDFLNLFCQKIIENKYNVVVFTELHPINFLIQINNTCRQNNIKFIYACCLGLAGYIFTDFGDKHTIFENGQPVEK